MDRVFLAIVGVAYIFLAVFCSLKPSQSADAVGFSLRPGSGQSEFLTVYGGLELALGLAFLWPILRSADTGSALTLCALVHGCLVLFRGASFLTFSGISSTTFKLAAVEWIFFLPAVLLLWRK